MCGSPRTGVWTSLSSSAWRSLGLTSGRSRARRSTAAGSRSGTIAAVSTTLLGTMIESLALAKRRVEQAERGHDALDLAGDAAGLEAHAVADPERPRRDQHDAGDQVAERLLRRETEDDRREGATDGQRAPVAARRRAARSAPPRR